MMYLKEKLEDYLFGIRSVILKDFQMKKTIHLEEGPYFATCLQRCPVDIGRRMEHFIATGQLQTRTGLDLMQVSARFLCQCFFNIHVLDCWVFSCC